ELVDEGLDVGHGPDQLDVADHWPDGDQLDRPVAEHLIRQAQIAALGVRRFRHGMSVLADPAARRGPLISPPVFPRMHPAPLAGPRAARENCVWVAGATSEFPGCARSRHLVGRGSLGSTKLLLRARGSESYNYEAPPGRPVFSTSKGGAGKEAMDVVVERCA